MVDRAVTRAEFSGADIDVVALSAVRATREAIVKRNGESLPSIAGAAAAGEKAGGKVFDGQTEVVVFPGDLPADPDVLFKAGDKADAHSRRTKRICASCVSGRRVLETTPEGVPALPHIRFDRALQFLIGDRLQ